MEVLYQLSYPGGIGHCSVAAVSRDPLAIVRLTLPLGALLMIGVGAYIYLTSEDEMLGGLLALFGLIDLLTTPFVLRLLARNRVDPDGNPYAREE